jgi:hypothetical protein
MLVLKNVICVAAVLAVVGLLGVAPCSATTIELLQNGSFDISSTQPLTTAHGAVATGLGFLARGLTAEMPNWTVYSDPGNPNKFGWYMEGSSWLGAGAPSQFAINIVAQSSQSVTQTFTVYDGYATDAYTIKFWQKNRGSGGLGVNLSVDAGALTGSNPTGVYSNAGWTQYTFNFGFTGASSATATLRFTAAADTGPTWDIYHGDGTFVDSVSVLGPNSAATPEPGTLALLAAGLAGLLCYAWRKQR